MKIPATALPTRTLYFETADNTAALARYALLENGRLTEYETFGSHGSAGDNAPATGAIYCALAGDTLKNTGFTFMTLSRTHAGTQRACLAGSTYPGGSMVLVQTAIAPQGDKFVRVSDTARLSGIYAVLLLGRSSGHNGSGAVVGNDTASANGGASVNDAASANCGASVNDAVSANSGAGAFLVSYSRQLRSKATRKLLGGLAAEYRAALSPEATRLVKGIIFRSAAAGRAEAPDAIRRDLDALTKKALALSRAFDANVNNGTPGLLYETDPALARVLRFSIDTVTEIHADAPELIEKLTAALPELKLLCVFERPGAFERAGIDRQYAALSGRQVMLPSDGNIVLDRLEALTVIDVNAALTSGGSHDRAEAILKVNLEAAAEIARQLRLRKITGMILCDFINMESEADGRALIEAFNSFLAADPAKTEIFGFTKLKLLELTRKMSLLS